MHTKVVASKIIHAANNVRVSGIIQMILDNVLALLLSSGMTLHASSWAV